MKFLHALADGLIIKDFAHAGLVGHADELAGREGHVEARLVLDVDHAALYLFHDSTAHGVEELHFVSYLKLCHNFYFFNGELNEFYKLRMSIAGELLEVTQSY